MQCKVMPVQLVDFSSGFYKPDGDLEHKKGNNFWKGQI